MADQLPPALVDPSELENGLLNLGITARDAMPAGGRVSIETSPHILVDEHDPVRGLKRGTYLVTGLALSLAHAFASHSGGNLTLAPQKPSERRCEHALVVEEDDAVRSIAVRLWPRARISPAGFELS